MSTAPRSPVRTIATLAIALLSLWFVAAMAWVMCSRADHPYELEWMGGAFLDHVCRILDGEPIYVAPDESFVPFLYAPLYFYLSAGVALATGEGFLPLRLVSIAATLGTLVLLFVLVRRRTGRRLPALVACGLWAACYDLVDSWYDTSRADSLFVLLVAATLCASMLGRARPSAISAGLLLTVAYLAKQTAFLLAPPIAVALLVVDWRRSLWFVASFALAWSSSVLVLDWLHDGWFWFYTWELPRRHEYIVEPLFDFWRVDMRWLVPALLLGAGRLVALLRRGEIRRFLELGAIGGGLLLAGCLSRMHVGGAENVLMPAYLGVCLLAALAFGRAQGAGERVAATALVLAQLAMLIYDPRPYVPTAEDRAVGDRLVQMLREAEGEVVVPLHGHLARRAGKAPTAHAMAVLDVVRAREPGLSAELERRFWGLLRDRNVALVVLDDNITEFVRTPDRPDRGFELVELGYTDVTDLVPEGRAFQPVVGLQSRPRYVFRRR